MKCSCKFEDQFDEWKLAVIKCLFDDRLLPISYEKEPIVFDEREDGILLKIRFKVK